MNLSAIKHELLLPERELILNKKIVINNKPVIIASITQQEGIIKLWVFQQAPKYALTNVDEERMECTTNRDKIRKSNSYFRNSLRHISEITIQGVKLPIAQSTYGVIEYDPISWIKNAQDETVET